MSLEVLTMGGGGASASILVTGLSETDIVTASKDGKTIAAKWNSAENRFEIARIKSYGTWVVTATDGVKSKTRDVLVDAAVEYKIFIDLYKLWLYRDGDEFEDVTGGWGLRASTDAVAGTKNSTNMYLGGQSNVVVALEMLGSVDVTGYTKLKAEVENISTVQSYPAVYVAARYADTGSTVKSVGSATIGTQIYEIDVSAASKPVYVLAEVNGSTGYQGYIYKVWLE